MLCCVCGHRDATKIQKIGNDDNQILYPMCNSCFCAYVDKFIKQVESSLFNEQKGEQDEE